MSMLARNEVKGFHTTEWFPFLPRSFVTVFVLKWQSSTAAIKRYYSSPSIRMAASENVKKNGNKVDKDDH